MSSVRVRRSPLTRGLALLLAVFLAVPFSVLPAAAAPGDITDNSGLIPFSQAYFAFEVESVLSTLKEVPIWDEIERMLDNPYAFQLEPGVAGNYQGWPSYRLTQSRRRSFVYRNGAGQPCAPLTAGCNEVALPRHVIHPLNYNHMNGEEFRLLNPGFEEAPWQVSSDVVLVEAANTDPSKGPLGLPRYAFTYAPIVVSAGDTRVEEDEAAPDFNSPIKPDDLTTCIVSAESQPGVPEGSIICGGDPGEPGYAGFGFLRNEPRRGEQYSTPVLRLNNLPAAQRGPAFNIASLPLGTGNARLFDPAGCAERNLESPGSCSDGGFVNRLRKPTVRPTPSSAPDYLANSEDSLRLDPAALTPSNENDYFRGGDRTAKVAARNAAAALGKALFWDMQVGSDGVQACASCHFHAGVDNRTKNQLNPNHLGGDLTLQLHGGVANGELTVDDFPFHKLADITVSGERAADGDGIVDNNPGNVVSHVNDVASSMGVVFSPFTDIPPIGTFVTNASGVRVLPPDPRTVGAIDPIPLFQDLRRVEPRNTPTLFAATMNFDNFWDGRARHDFNGGSVFGPSDPQYHVMVNDAGTIVPTRQIIRFASLASLATGPALSEFEMSFAGRNWPKIGRKLLQGAATTIVADNVTPLANQLVSTTDSVLGIYSNQGGSACTTAAIPLIERSGSWVTNNNPGLAVGKPGICISYAGLIRRAFYPALWDNTSMHLNGCYSNPADTRSPRCVDMGVPVAIQVLADGAVSLSPTGDPFDGYVLTPRPGAATPLSTDRFTQMEANMSLFFGLAVHAWGTMLVPDDTPMDRFFDANPDSFMSFGEANEPFLVPDLLTCGDVNPLTGQPQGAPCVTEVGNFKRDPGLTATLGCETEGCTEGTPAVAGGTRTPGSPDPLMGLDFFLGSNLSLKNPDFRSLRCGECHAGGTLTDNTVEISHQLSFNDWVAEFRTGQPGVGLFPEPLGRSRVISGFALEGELQENAQDGIERNVVDFCTVEPCVDAAGNPIPGGLAGGFPQGQALLDNGVYNIGVTPIANDVSRGGPDGFGWPLNLAYLAMKNLGGTDYSPGGDNPGNGFAQPPTPGIPMPTFDPAVDPASGGLFDPTAQDQQINPGFAEEPADPQLPPYLAPWATNIPVGDEVQQDELFFGLNTLCAEPILEGFVDSFGPFNPAAIIGETMNNASQPLMASWPNVNRVNTQGSFKAPPLRNVALSGPYLHNGGKITLRQELDFYLRGGDFPKSNAAHRDFLIADLDDEDEALGGFTEAEKDEITAAVIDFLLELTDERVAFERAPFDHPEIFVPLDGAAPDNTFGRPGLLANIGNGMFKQVPAIGASGNASPLPNFLGIANGPRLVGAAANCVVTNNHYCH